MGEHLSCQPQTHSNCLIEVVIKSIIMSVATIYHYASRPCLSFTRCCLILLALDGPRLGGGASSLVVSHRAQRNLHAKGERSGRNGVSCHGVKTGSLGVVGPCGVGRGRFPTGLFVFSKGV